MLEVIKHHECETLEKYNNNPRHSRNIIAIQKLSDNHWYWAMYNDKKGNTANGIGYCPYCGIDLTKEVPIEETN